MTDTTEILRGVLADALARTWRQAEDYQKSFKERSRDWAVGMRSAWIISLRDSFGHAYRSEIGGGCVAVFGGNLATTTEPANAPRLGIDSWRRGEFLFDVAVVKTDTITAAYASDEDGSGPGRKLPRVTGAIWAVESELSDSGTHVAEDISKLQVARADHVLLVARHSAQPDPEKWLAFLGSAMEGVAGDAYVALIHTYASQDSGSMHWWNRTAEITLYRCDTSNGALESLGLIAASSAVSPIEQA